MVTCKFKSTIVVALLITISITFISPATTYASALDNLIFQTAQSSTEKSSGNGLFDILIGLLIGKLFGNSVGNSDTSLSKVLGLAPTPSSGQSTATGNAVIEIAKKYMGVPYVWGGETPDGFDCSGFTQYVMKQNGITIPRTAAEQFAAGTGVEKANLQIGDLVFFTTYKPGASHVGFYMGNGKFIHASSAAAQVTISSLDEEYYTKNYVGARRYIK